eukprot:TRINITY_DN35_c0_g1_i3.p1 TRINITY_DN35_c0_g1~~TRINITY_DN35_c0_g1_i3.p1  ORF type:complete len:2413 (-),score=644.06 TRINITY_DN35_c0_g1_i3:90-7328(-)
MIRRPPRSTQSRSSAASDVYKRQGINAEYMGKAKTSTIKAQMKNLYIVPIFLLFALASAGKIYPWGEPLIRNPNKDRISSISIFFTLESPLKAGNYLRITLPFANNVFSGTTAGNIRWNEITTNTRGLDPLADTVLSKVASSVSYTSAAPFAAIITLSEDLGALKNYAIRIPVSTQPTDNAGFIGYIRVETLSPAPSVTAGSGSDQPIIYDSNLYFAPVHLFPAPAAPTTFAINATDTNKGNAGATYVASIYIKPNGNVWPRPSILITWTTSTYTMAGCVSFDTGASSTATALDAAQYTCTPSTGQLLIHQNVPLLANQTAIYRVNLTNAATTTSTTFTVQVYHRYNQNITDYATGVSQISSTATATTTTTTTTTPAFTYVKVLLSWGIDRATDFWFTLGSATTATSSAGLEKIFRIYASTPESAALSGPKWYQSLRFVWRPNLALSGNYTVKVGLGDKTKADALETSIVHNLGTNANCVFDKTDATNAFLTCTNVASMSSSSDSYVAAKVWLDSTLVTTNAVAGVFSQVQIFTVTADTSTPPVYTSTSYIAATAANSTYLAANQLTKEYTRSFSGNGALLAFPATSAVETIVKATTLTDYTTAKITPTIAEYLGGIVGSANSNEKYTIGLATIFLTKADFLSSGKTSYGGTAAAVAVKSGIDIFLNPNFFNVPTTGLVDNCGQALAIYSATAVPAGAGIHCGANKYSVGGVAKWVRLRQVLHTAPTTDTALDYAADKYLTYTFGTSASTNAITYNGAFIGSSLLANEYAGDGYAALYVVGNDNGNTAIGTNFATITADQGEIGSQSTTVNFNLKVDSIVNPFFFTYSSVAPVGSYAKIESFVTGYTDAATSTDLRIALYNLRGYFNTGDPNPGTNAGKLYVFFGEDRKFLTPAGLADAAYSLQIVQVGSQIRCGNGAGSTNTCLAERLNRARGTGEVTASADSTSKVFTQNNIDLYAVVSSDYGFGGATDTSKIFRVYFVHQADTYVMFTKRIRFGFQNSQTKNVFLTSKEVEMQTATNYAGTAFTADAAPTTAITLAPAAGTTCDQAGTAGTTKPYIFLNPAATDTVNANISSASISYALSAAGASFTAEPKRGGVFYCAVNYNFQNTGFTASAPSGVTSSTEGCWAFNYKSSTTLTNSVYCVFCPFITTAPTTTAALIAVTNVKAYINQDIQTQTFGNVVIDVGRHLQGHQCAYTKTVFAPGTATFQTSGSYYGLNGHKVTITLGLPNGLTNAETITISGYATTNTTAITAATSTDSNFPYFSNPDATVICKFGTTTAASANPSALNGCTAAVSGGRLTITRWTLSTADAAATSFTVILWGVVGNAAASTNPATTHVFVKTTKTVSSTDGTIDTNPYTAPGTWTFTNATTNDFAITNTLYQRNYINGRGFLKWDFTLANARPLFQRDVFTFKLDAFSSASDNNVQSALRCLVTDSSDNLLQIFQECTFATGTPNTLTIRPAIGLVWELSNAVWRVYVENIRVTSQTVKGIYGQVNYWTLGTALQARATATSDLAPATLAANQSFPSGFPTIQKTYNQFGVLQDIAFNLTTNLPFNDTCKIAVVFPSYYQDGLNRGWGNPYCTIQGAVVNCVVIRKNQLIVTGPATALAASANFTLRIQGVISSDKASSTASLESFFISLSQDQTDAATSVIYAGTINDVAGSSAAVGLIHVNLGTVSTSDVRASASYAWSFTLTADVPTTSSLQIAFTNTWGTTLGVSTPACKIFDYSDTAKTALSGTQVLSGPYAHLPVSTALSRNSLYTVECSGLRNIDVAGNYRSDDIQLRVVDNNNNVVAISAEHAHNVDYAFAFTVRTGFVATSFTGISTDIAHPTQLRRGQYSTPITLTLGETANRNFALSVAGANWALLPTTVNVTIGQPTDTQFRLGVATNAPLGLYAITFTHSDTTRYLQPPVAWVQVISGGSAITRTPDSVSAIVGSSTVPVVFDASANPPFSDVSITPVLNAANNVFSVSPASISLTTARPFGSFVFRTLSTAVAGNSTGVTYTLGGTNKDSYTVPTAHNIQVTADTNNQATAIPALVVSERSGDARRATTKIVNLNLDKVDTATVYWCAAFPGQNFTANQLWAMGANMTALRPEDPAQIQCGVVTFAKGDRQITLAGLKPNTKYEVTAFANSIFNQNSTVQIFAFSTISNGGAVTRVLFQFTAYPSATVRQTLLCELSRQLTAPNQKVVSIHGDFCQGGTAFYSQTNSSNGLAVYFYPSDTEDDTITKTLNTNLNNIRTALNTSLGATAGWTGYTLDGTILPYAPSSAAGTTSAGDTYIVLTGTSLNQSGFVFVGLDATNGAAPPAVQLKQGRNAAGAALTQFANFYYIQGGSALTQNFSGLTQNTSYTIFVTASNGDPSQTAAFTSVVTLPVSTTSPAPVNPTPVSAMALFTSLILTIICAFTYMI